MAFATIELPVSISTRPSSVCTAVTFANAGTNATPSQISATPPMCRRGWNSLVVASPLHRRSARVRTSVAISHALLSWINGKARIPGRKFLQRCEHHIRASFTKLRSTERAGWDAHGHRTCLPRSRHIGGRITHIGESRESGEYLRLLAAVHVREQLIWHQPYGRQARLRGNQVLRCHDRGTLPPVPDCGDRRQRARQQRGEPGQQCDIVPAVCSRRALYRRGREPVCDLVLELDAHAGIDLRQVD